MTTNYWVGHEILTIIYIVTVLINDVLHTCIYNSDDQTFSMLRSPVWPHYFCFKQRILHHQTLTVTEL